MLIFHIFVTLENAQCFVGAFLEISEVAEQKVN